MTAENQCPHCGKPVPPTALGGICPECMLKAGLADTGEVGPGGTVVAKTSRPAPPVEEIAPHFPHLEILECLGRGGMGAVYKARQPKLDRFVALKILTRGHDPKITDTEFAARFQQEARALARITHPDIVAVYDFGEAGGYHYLLMEFVDGLTLRQLLQTHKLTPEQALSIVPKICEALQFAHERGIVHRDIKPENILLDKQGRVKIADFGIAKIVGPEAAGAGLTGAKDVIGTPHYMAPEQIEKPQTVDHRADIYSLGVVFYEMLTGELPLGKFQSPSRMVHVDVRLDEVVLHALEKNPDRRYQHASEVKKDVETIAATPESGSSRREEAQTEKAEARGQTAESGQNLLTSAATLRGATAARWTARVLGTLWMLLILAFVVGEGSPAIGTQPGPVQFMFAGLALMLTGCVVGWWRDLPAALLTLSGWILFHIANGRVPVLNPFHIPLLAGLLFAVSWVARRLPSQYRQIFPALAVFILPPLLFTWFLLWGHLPLGVNLDAAVQFWTGLFGLPVSAGVGGLLLWALRLGSTTKAEDDASQKWSWLALGGIAALVVSLPLGGGAMVLLQLLLRESRWNPGAGEAFLTIGLCGGAILTAGASVLFGIATLRQAQRTGRILRGHLGGMILTRFWPYLGIAAVLFGLLHHVSRQNYISAELARLRQKLETQEKVHKANVARLRQESEQRKSVSPPTTFDSARAVALFNEIEDFGHEFEAAFTSRNLAAAQMGTTRLLNLFTNFNAAVRGMDLGFPPAILDDVAKVRQALDEGDWEKARRLGQRNEEYARAFKRISDRMAVLARKQWDQARRADATGTSASVPPVVVETIPPSGAADVDPSLTEIRVTFSKDMITHRMWSFVQVSSETFPKSNGEVHYLGDGRTCVLPVQLEPGKLYAIWINSETYHAFRDREGRSAVPYLLIFETRKSK